MGAVGLTGCGAALTGALAGGISAADKGGSSRFVPPPAANAAPSVGAAAPVGDTNGGAVTLELLLLDAESDPVAVELAWSTDPDEPATARFAKTATGSLTAAQGGAATDLQAVPTAPAGLSYRFAWNTALDLGATLNQGTVRVQVLLGGQPAFTTSFFSVDNTQAPMITQVTPPPLPAGASSYADAQFASRSLPFSFTLTDADAQPATLTVLFSTDGGQTFPPTQVAAGTFADASGASVSGPLPTSAGGTSYTFSWASAANGITRAGSLALRLQASDSKTGAPRDSAALAIDNGSFSILLDTPGPTEVDRVELDYLLFDAAAAPLEVQFEYSTTGAGGPFRRCTEARQAPSEGTAGLSASVAGTSHSFLWHSFADLASLGLSSAQVVVRATALRAATQVAAAPAITGSFVVDNRLIRSVFSEGAPPAPAVATATQLDAAIEVAASAGLVAISTGFENLVLGVDRGPGLLEGAAGGGTNFGEGAAGDVFLENPRGVAVDARGTIFFGDRRTSGHVIARVDPISRFVTFLVPAPGLQDVRGPALQEVDDGALYYALDVRDGNGYVLYRIPQGGGAAQALGGGGATAITSTAEVALAQLRLNIEALAAGPFPETLLISETTASNQVIAVNFGAQDRLIAGVTVRSGFARRIAGTGQAGDPNQGTPLFPVPDTAAPLAATSLDLVLPGGLCVHPQTREVLIAEFFGNRVWAVHPTTGVARIAVGSVFAGLSGDGGPATEARLDQPTDVALDPTGGFLIADFGNARVRRVAPDETISTVAGAPAPVGDGLPGPQAVLSRPQGVSLGSPGLLVASLGQERVRVLSGTFVASTLAGNGEDGAAGDGGQAQVAVVGDPVDAVADTAGNVYISQGSGTVRRVTPAGVITTVAGSETAGNGGPLGIEGGPALQTAMSGFEEGPAGLALRGGQLLLVADPSNAKVWLVNLGTGPLFAAGIAVPPGEVRRVAGDPQTPAGGTDPTAATAQALVAPVAVDWFGSGDFVLVDRGGHAVYRVTGTTGAIARIVGTGLPGFIGDGGPATAAQLDSPAAALLDQTVPGETVLYLADAGNQRIRMVNLGAGGVTRHGVTVAPGNIDTIAGSGTSGFAGDGGPATAARLALLQLDGGTLTGLSLDCARGGHLAKAANGGLLIGDSLNDRVRRIEANGRITTLAGGGKLDGDGTGAGEARLNQPLAIAAAAFGGDYYVLDSGRVRRAAGGNTVVSTVAGTGVSGPADVPGVAVAATEATFAFNEELNLEQQFNQVTGSSNATSPALDRLQDLTVDFVAEGVQAGMYVAKVRAGGADPRGVVETVFVRSVIGSNELELVPPFAAALQAGDSYQVFVADGPRGLAAIGGTSNRLLAVADTLNHAVRLANLGDSPLTVAGLGAPLQPGQLCTVAGGNGEGATDGLIAASELTFPQGVAPVASGLVVVADTGNHAIRAVNLATTSQPVGSVLVPPGEVATLAGPGQGVRFPTAVVVDALGNVLWCEQGDTLAATSRVRMLVQEPGSYYGLNGLTRGALVDVFRDSAAASNVTPLPFPRGLALDAQGHLHVVELAYGAVYRIDRSTGFVSRVAGVVDPGFGGTPPAPSTGFGGDGGVGSSALLRAPWGIACDAAGYFWLIDAGNLRVRRARRFP